MEKIGPVGRPEIRATTCGGGLRCRDAALSQVPA
jgi:hypothetical protein